MSAESPTGLFADYAALIEALKSTVGCERLADAVGTAFADRGQICRTEKGPVTAMYGMSSKNIDDFMAHQREAPGSPEVVVVRGDNWLVTARSKDSAEAVAAAIGGTVVVVYGPEQAAAQAREDEQASEDYQASLPDRQRPDLDPADYPPEPTDRSQGLIVHLGPATSEDDLAASDLDDAFAEAIESAGLGVSDGDENGPDGWSFFYYGPSAEAMAKAVGPVLAQLRIPPGSYLRLVDGDKTIREQELTPREPQPR